MLNSTNDLKVSVIIPVYNASKTLPECLDSILNQTMPEFEVICIDDGSADDSWEILTAYASKDSRIRIVHQENQGPGKTRNHGIQLAMGKYIIFVDSDDYIKSTALEAICSVAYEKDADIVLYDADKFDAVTRKRIPIKHFLRKDLLPEGLEVFCVRDCPETILQISSPGPWSRAYRRELVEREKLCFSELKNSEDLFFSYSSMTAAERIAVVPQKLYMYRVGQTTNVESNKANAPLDFIEAYLELYRKLVEKNLFELCKKSYGLRFSSSIVHAISTIDSESARKEICQRLCDEDVVQMHVLDQSDGFYGNRREIRQVRYLLQDYCKAPVTEPKVSVIIPVFNVEKYLADCLESLLNQTMPDFEILCMDDGSTDNSRNLLTLYSRLDSRIKVFLSENEGAAVQRNRGIDLAVGEYLYFMDSDDMAADTLLEKTYSAAIHTNADVVVFDVNALDMRTGKLEEQKYCFRIDNAPVGKSVFSIVDVPDRIFQISNPSPWTKLIRREFVLSKQLRYQNLQNTNDAFFAHLSMALANRITLVNERLYIYRIGMTENIQSNKEKNPTCMVDAYMEIYHRLVDEQIFGLCEKSWVAEFLAIICFTLKTVSSRKAYRELYLRLNQPEVVATGYLAQEEDFYSDRYHYNLVKKFLSSPAKFAGIDERNVRVLISREYQDPIVSVIIPVYNAEEYLSECLNSIRDQTLQNIEIICIDDGSTDSSLSILCQAAEEDPRVRVMAQNNSGQSAARNTGIQASRGKYLYYLDSDDMLEPDTLQFLIDTVEDNDLDCVLFGGKTVYSSEELQKLHSGFSDYYHYKASCTVPMPGTDLLVLMQRTREYRVSPCMQLVKAELIHDNGIRFYEGIIHEDNLYSLEVLLHSQRCMAISEQFYCRRIRDNSTMTATASIARVLGYLTCYTESLGLVNRFDLTAPQYDAIHQFQDVMIYHVRKYYEAISSEERIWVRVFCTGAQRCVYRTLVNLFSSAAKQNGPAPAANAQNKRLNDHDTALRYAQTELAQNRTRLNDHDTALRYAQDELENARNRMNDHDTALRYAQDELENARIRLNDHDTALRYAQTEIAELRLANQNRLANKILRTALWLPRKIKRLLQ